MDASEPLQAEACCDVCGYPRRGLSPDSKCPECGSPPPLMAVLGLGPQGVSNLTQSLTQSELRWLRIIAIGLLGFVVYSLLALRVTLIMPIGSFELGALNFPGPKLNGTTPVQRAIGGQPGEWGVAGSMAMLLQVAAIWLLTERRALRGDWEGTFSIRSCARWVSILTAGALLGIALSGTGEYIPPKSDSDGGFLICAIMLCELPANALIYLHLKKLAVQLECKRAEALLRVCVWIVPAIIFGGAVLIGIDIFRDTEPGSYWHVVTAGYGAAAIATGAAATAAVGYLLATAMAAGFGSWMTSLSQHAGSAVTLLRRAVELIQTRGSQWCIVVGLFLWLVLMPAWATGCLWRTGRIGFMGNVPMFNFIGPKVAGPIDLQPADYDPIQYPNTLSALMILAAVWLMTASPYANPWLRKFVRLAATLTVAMPIGVQLGLWSDESQSSFLTAFAVCCEIPATMLLYLYLAQVAKNIGQSPKKLRWICAAIPFAAGAPLVAFALGYKMSSDRHDPIWAIVAGLDIAASLSLTFIATAAVFQLAWALFLRAAGITSHPARPAPPPPALRHPA